MKNKNICMALEVLCPGAEWNVRGDSLAGIQWLDKIKIQPTDDDLTTQISTQN
jgi:hypothetical protein